MAEQTTIISYGQIFSYSEEATSIRLHRYLNEQKHDTFALKNFVAYVCTVSLIYATFCPGRIMIAAYYHQEIFEAYSQEDWSLTMMRRLGQLREILLPFEWAVIQKMYYRKKRLEMMRKYHPNQVEQLQSLDELATKVLGAEAVAEVIAELAGGDGLLVRGPDPSG